MPIIHYDTMFKFYNQVDRFDATNDLIVTVYKQARKVDSKDRVQPFYHEKRNNTIYMLDELSEKYKKLFPNGLYLCNDSNDATKSLLFVFPKYNETLDALLAQHWHFLIKDTKKGKRVGLHETVYIVPSDSRTVCDHISLEYMDPITLPTKRFDKDYMKAPEKRDALVDIIGACAEATSGGTRKPRRRVQTKTPGIIRSREFHNLFTRFETGYKTAGVKELYVISTRQDDGSYMNVVGFIPRGRVKIEERRAIPTVYFETTSATLGMIRNGLLRHSDELVRQDDE